VTDAQGAVYVYGVLRAAEQESAAATGVTGASVRTVEHGELAALVSDLEGGALMAAREVRAHWRVVEAASEAATVIPVRFGTVMASNEAVVDELLAPQAERLTTLLHALAGQVQLGVKGEYEQDALLREVVREAPAVQALRKRVQSLPVAAGYYDRIRLGELVAAEVERRRSHDTGLALERLSAHARATKTNEPKTANGAFDLAFLVERDGIDPFSAAVGELSEALGERVDIRYVGPLPPYSFVDDDIGVGATSWA
jgi:Gas vesicle synthesis protein GvpL/GvpF